MRDTEVEVAHIGDDVYIHPPGTWSSLCLSEAQARGLRNTLNAMFPSSASHEEPPSYPGYVSQRAGDAA